MSGRNQETVLAVIMAVVVVLIGALIIGTMIARNRVKPFKFDTSYPTNMLSHTWHFPTLPDETPDGQPARVQVMNNGRLIGRQLQDGTWQGFNADEYHSAWMKSHGVK